MTVAVLAALVAGGPLRAGVSADPSWPPAVRTAFENVTALPGTDRDAVVAAVRKLAGLGVVARPAVEKLANDPSLPVPHRAMSGILLAHYHAFDPATLRRFLGLESPYPALEAAQLLGRLGGDENKAAVVQAAAKRPNLANALNKIVAAWPPGLPLPPATANLLNTVLLDPDERARRKAVTVLTVDYGPKVKDPLEWALGSGVVGEPTQMDLAAGIVRICKDSGADLKPLCQRGKQKYLRLLAIQELAGKGEAEKAFLRQLAADPGEPLKEHIEKALRGK